MSTPRKGTALVALLAGGSLALSACGGGRESSGGTSETSEGGGETQATTITVAHEQEFNAYNNNTAADNAVQNTVVLNQVLRGFWDYAEDGSIAPDEEFGTFEQTSEDPLTVRYTIAEDAVWSDGEPIDCDDMLLVYAANSGKYSSAEVGPDEVTPTAGFSSASTTGYDLMEKPTCADGDKELEVTYTEPFADWQSMFSSISILPAHVAERESGVEDVIAAVEADDRAQLDPIATFYNTGWKLTPGTIDPAIHLSAGPYNLDTWQAGQSITLTANPEWWGEPPASETIVIRFIEAVQQATALQNGEIQVAEPQPAQDILAQLEAIGDTVEIQQGEEYTFEHLDFNFTGPFADADLRRAFALCVPRDQIVETLIQPVNEDAEVLNSLYSQPFEDEYDSIVEAAYDGTYDTANVEESRSILESKGATGQVVRIGYQSPNQRRTDAVSLIRDSCNQAGFDVQDAGQEDFFGSGLAAGNFDVALFAWAGAPIVSSNASTYVTGGGNNNGKYSNPQVDELTAQLNTTPDVDAQLPIIQELETIFWQDLPSIPLFSFPGLVASDTTVENVVFQPAQSQVTWNMDTWATAQAQ